MTKFQLVEIEKRLNSTIQVINYCLIIIEVNHKIETANSAHFKIEPEPARAESGTARALSNVSPCKTYFHGGITRVPELRRLRTLPNIP